MDAIAPELPFSAEDFRRRAMAERVEEDTDYGDHRWNAADMRETFLNRELREAAVLVPVVDHGGEATVILTQRTEALRSHSGQIAFPGGRIDPSDGSAEAAALRETFEEVGLRPDQIEVIGRIPDYVSASGYRIAPVLGIVRPGFELRPNPAEVDAVFEVPLRFLMEPANHQRQSRVWLDRERVFYAMPYGEHYIWGVTAGIIRTLYERLYA